MPYFIHIRDPQFHEPPWPGLRRLGPYETKKQAEEQAAHDADRFDVVGVFSQAESEKGEEGRI